MQIFLFTILMILLVIFGPIFTIWSINTLFPVADIPYTIETWAAAIILAGVFRTTINRKD
jgi:hypothetical protein